MKKPIFYTEDFKVKVIDRLLLHISKGLYNYLSVTHKEFPEVSYSTLRLWADEAFKTYSDYIAPNKQDLKLQIYTKFFEYQQTLEDIGKYEDAAKMLDRIVKLYQLNDPEEIIHRHDTWSVQYDISLDEKEDNNDEDNIV